MMYAHGAHISQPPHTAGKPFSGLRSRIDPEQIPSPVEVAEADEEAWEGRQYTTLSGDNVPLSTTNYVSIDQGNSSPRFVRLTAWHIPSTSDLAESCQVPLAAIIQPFADIQPGEDDVPLVNCSGIGGGPARCEKCMGYVNSWCTWVRGGTHWRCNLCGHQTEVVPEYFSNLDANQMRMDQLQRPELTKGTVDFALSSSSTAYDAPHPPPRLVPSTYSPLPPPLPTSRRKPEPMHVLFVFDVSLQAQQSGLLKAACDAVRCVLFGGEVEGLGRVEPCFPASCSVGIITYDDTVHFYDLSPTRDAPAMLAVPDIYEEMFCPLQDGVFVDPHKSRNLIENLLIRLPNMTSTSPMTALGATLRGALAALQRHGGQAILFTSSGCNVGPGSPAAAVGSLPTDESTYYDTDKEKQLFMPKDPLWQDLGEELAESGVGVSMFVGTAASGLGGVDFGSIGLISTLTGGSIHYYPRFSPALDTRPLVSTLSRVLSRRTGYNAQARVRFSQGLRLRNYHGTFHQSSPTDLELGVLHADSTFAVSFDHWSSRRGLNEREYAFLQCAVLYTTVSGERRVRVMNVALQVAALAGNVFRYADVDATVCFLAKETMSSLSSHTLSNIRDGLTEKCSCILLAYRRNCAAATSPSQLILPEAFKLLPLYILALHKNRSLRAHNVPADARNFYAHRILSMSTRSLLRHIYPRFLALHDLTDDIALPSTEVIGSNDTLKLPSLMRDTYTNMHADGIYLIDNEELMVLWVGSKASPQVLQDLFGVQTPHEIDHRMTELPQLPSLLSSQVRNILAHRRVERHGVDAKLLIARQNLDAAEIELSDMLVEDQNCGAMAYIDYLCFVHKHINLALTNNTSIASVTSYGLRGTPW